MFKLITLILSAATSSAFTYLCFSDYYAPSSPLLFSLMGLSVLFACFFTLLSSYKKNRILALLSCFIPFIAVYCICYNFVISAILFLCTIALALFLPKKHRYKKISFNADMTLTCTVAYLKKPFSKRANRFLLIFSSLFFVLFCLTCLYTTPSHIWQTKAFPIDLSAKKTFSENVYPSGKVTGTAWYDADALLVQEFFDIETPSGTVTSPCLLAGLREGDIITKINSQSANSSDFIVNRAVTFPTELSVLRIHPDGKRETLTFSVMPAYGKAEEKYLIGISYYPSAAVATSIQTVSFIYPDTGYFAATAHSSSEVYTENENLTGVLLDAVPTGRDDDGLTISPTSLVLGTILHSNDYGSFGICASNGTNPLPIAKKSEVRYGKASLLSNLEGESLYYSIFITGTYRIANRDVIAFIVDDERIKELGGITKGMSGSPIIQNGKIVGALSNMDFGGESAYATFAYDMAHELFLASDNFTQ